MIYIGVEKELSLLDYDSLLYRFFKGEHIYVGFSDPFETTAKIICIITPNEERLFEDTLQIDGIEEQESHQLAIQIAQKIASVHQTRTLCIPPPQLVAEFPDSFLLWKQEQSFLVQEIKEEKDGLPAGLQVIKPVDLHST